MTESKTKYKNFKNGKISTFNILRKNTKNIFFKKKKRERIGIITSANSEKTCIILSQKQYKHPRYGKIITQNKRYMVHDQYNKAKSGDLILIEEVSPLSRCKRWNFVRVLNSYESKNIK